VMRGRSYVVPDDVAAAAAPALAHRVLTVEEGTSVVAGREVVEECLADVAPPAL